MSLLLLPLKPSLIGFRIREDMQFGIIYLRSGVHPLSFEQFHALELVKQSGLESNTLYASFVSDATGTVKYGFDSSAASSQGTSGHAPEMFDAALGNPIRLDLLLEKLQTISEGAFNMILYDLHLSL